jgi:geranylgeranyl pyrophosphate synthase
MRHAVLLGGKRMRPLLAFAAAAVSGDAERALPPAVAVELIHAYSLVHDDLPAMDDDDWRRGQPTCHVKFGQALAILAGDALQALAFEMAATSGASGRGGAAALTAELASAAGSRGVVGGQAADIAAPRPCDATRLQFIHLHKTADLFRAACRMGGLAVGASRRQLAALGEYGTQLGLAFQLTDDLLDATPSAQQDEPSCLDVYAPAQAREQVAEATRRAIRAAETVGRGTVVAPLVAVAQSIVNRTN